MCFSFARAAEIIVGTQQGELYQIGIREPAQRSANSPLPKSKVKDLMKQLCMRQICPGCACALASVPEIARNACQACDASLCAASNDGTVPPEKSLLCRLLLHMTRLFGDQKSTDGSSGSVIHLPSGVYTVPVSATLMLQV